MKAELLGEETQWMKKKLRKKPSKKGSKADDTLANTKEEENTNQKTPRKLHPICSYWRMK